eukprot:gnl/TRDRNA2_/TRDRNA2_185351_c0_seq1.p1 gnl/TRDRNA2_/TRDRNA2_185351_c0~~gnl/TRDRNA2_/TRDRNA2_185351_c0_seq1.p1  ORF type:complete len:484 (+),score=78.12 gnl/TRDRNA2_/TRDRNA2_185351_c0_seq1:82-1533(+)
MVRICFALKVFLLLGPVAALPGSPLPHKKLPKESADFDLTSFVQLSRNVDTIADASSDFASFVQKYGRKYKEGSQEYKERQAMYLQSVVEVERLNAQPGKLWKAGVNHLADWSQKERQSLFGYKRMDSATSSSQHGSVGLAEQQQRPKAYGDSMTWSHLKSLATAVDQMECGSCWAVATTRMMAAHSEIHMGSNARNFSTQELIDCSPNTKHCGGKGGCDGATVTLGLDYIFRHGISTIPDYPYYAQTDECRRSHPASNTNNMLTVDQIINEGKHPSLADMGRFAGDQGFQFGMTGWERLPKNKESPIIEALNEKGPVAVSVAASDWSFYQHGIFTCDKPDVIINHAVLLIGYAKDSKTNKKYWHIQNSWGPTWGEHGMIRLHRRDNEGSFCGIDDKPEDGSGCDGGPPTVEVCGTCGILYETVIPHFGTASSDTTNGKNCEKDTSSGEILLSDHVRGVTAQDTVGKRGSSLAGASKVPLTSL